MNVLKAWIIIPVFNRREITLACLRSLQPGIASGSFEVVVVDDASSDGTSEAIMRDFPEVHALQGGNLYWTGAMEKGMRYADARGANVFVWLNDDVGFSLDGIQSLVENAREIGGIVSAVGRGKHLTGETYYMYGFRKNWWNLSPAGEEIFRENGRIDSSRGNLVAISRNVVEKIGFPDGENIPHAYGDADFSLRAKRAGCEVRLQRDVFVDELHPNLLESEPILLSEQSNRWIHRNWFAKNRTLYLPANCVYRWRHWKFAGLLYLFCFVLRIYSLLLVKSLLPYRVRIQLFEK